MSKHLLSSPALTYWQERIRRSSEEAESDIVAWQKGTAADWAVESHQLAETVAYQVPETGEITAEYTAKAIEVIRQRLKQAGIRLAWVLNEAFK